jgi:AraC family transcriptional activator of mtrCDE
LRIRHACQLLKNNHTVEQACGAVGYQSIAAFTRAFAKVVGVQPGAYRKQHEGR